MNRIYHEEEHALREQPGLLILLATLPLAVIIWVGSAVFQPVESSESWRNGSESAPVFLFLFMVCATGVGGWVVYSTKVSLRIDSEGIHYRFFPNEPRWKRIAPGSIEEYALVKSNFWLSFGHYRGILKKTKTINIGSPVNLYLRLTDGKQLYLGTRNREGVDWAMKRLMNKQETA